MTVKTYNYLNQDGSVHVKAVIYDTRLGRRTSLKVVQNGVKMFEAGMTMSTARKRMKRLQERHGLSLVAKGKGLGPLFGGQLR